MGNSGDIYLASGLNKNLMHHAEVFVQQDVAMERECSGDVGISKIHSHFYTVIRRLAVPVRNSNGVEHNWVVYRFAVNLQHLEMDLVYVERVRLKRPVFNGPIFNRTDFGRDHGLFGGRKVDRDGRVRGRGLLLRRQPALGDDPLAGGAVHALGVEGCLRGGRLRRPSRKPV